MKNEAIKNREAIEEIRNKLNYGLITYDEAKAQAEPVIARMNQRAREIAKNYGRIHRSFKFEEIMR